MQLHHSWRVDSVLASRDLSCLPGMRSKLGTMKTVGMRLRRGYAPPAANAAEIDLRREEADDFAARVPVDKLVFVVHGIGQVSECYLSHWCCA